MANRSILSAAVLQAVDGTRLFYPCAGRDFRSPIRLFSPRVTDFMFVDRGYFSPGHQDTRAYGLDAPADKVEPILGDNDRYQLTRVEIDGPVTWNPEWRDIEPCIRTETYLHRGSGRQVKIRLRRGYGFSAFRKEIDELGVFYYRGDSMGEGGSGNFWMAADHVREILAKLIDGGLIVTDGSQAGRPHQRRPYEALSTFPRKSGETNYELAQRLAPFYVAPHLFTCVGSVGSRYRRTFAWQVTGGRYRRDQLQR
jgi:hypothetical protein